MILQALTNYYEKLLEQGKVDAPGWDKTFKVSFELRINDSGELVQVVDLRTSVQKGKKSVLAPREISVPVHGKRSSGISANFLCDTSSYMLGADEKGKSADKEDESGRSVRCFEAARTLHHELLDDKDSPAARAILAFFDNWDPSCAKAHPQIEPKWKDIAASANLLFGYEDANHKHYLATEDQVIRDAWQEYHSNASAEGDEMQCLVTGKKEHIARLHPNIKGVWGAQSSGASIVSFNAPAFCSYGYEQGANAPVSEYAANAYTTALNYLLANDTLCRHMGDTTVVCWAENASSSYQSLGMMGLFGADKASGISEEDVAAVLKRISEGKACNWEDEELQPGQHFYILGLAPNASRLSVRFFIRDTFGEYARHLQQHRDALEIVCPANKDSRYLSVWALAMETVNRNERNPSPSPQLAGDLLRAILTGGRYPATLINGVEIRIRAEQDITYGRAAIIKAYYIRNGSNNKQSKEVLTVKLNEESNYVPYVLGRLFAVLEAVQEAANPGINTTIRDRYFSSACATPAMVFPTLINLVQKHLGKLKEGQEIYYNRQISELLSKLTEDYPAHLSLPEQGSFQIGYYHQTQKRYTKKTEEE
jgi:CRISPR-associated protein Csd1